jgi:hypothetical protein
VLQVSAYKEVRLPLAEVAVFGIAAPVSESYSSTVATLATGVVIMGKISCRRLI